MGLKESGLRGSLRNVSVGIVAIPDPDIYLQDDWGDNKLTDREDSGTTTHNGVEGVYRPEWNTLQGSPTVTNNRVDLEGGDTIETGINVNLDNSLTIDCFDIDTSESGGSGSDQLYPFSIAETADIAQLDELQNGYAVEIQGDGDMQLRETTGSDNRTAIISGTHSSGDMVRVTRTASGEWELFSGPDEDNLTSHGTASDTTHTDLEHFGISARDENVDYDYDEVKVY